jgi:hypothetical protein
MAVSFANFHAVSGSKLPEPRTKRKRSLQAMAPETHAEPASHDDAILVDCRPLAEWYFTGMLDLTATSKGACRHCW